jgi:hypothetical protein
VCFCWCEQCFLPALLWVVSYMQVRDLFHDLQLLLDEQHQEVEQSEKHVRAPCTCPMAALGIRRHDRWGCSCQRTPLQCRPSKMPLPARSCHPLRVVRTVYQVGDAAERVDKGNTQLRKGIVRQENRRRRCCCLALFGTGALLMAGIVLGSLAGTRLL